MPVKRFNAYNVAIAALVISNAVGLIVATLALVKVSNKVDVNHGIATQIQAERIRAARVACISQNARHDRALSVTFALLARPAVPPKPPLTARQKRAQVAALRTWIQALVPRRDCRVVVKALAPSGHVKTTG